MDSSGPRADGQGISIRHHNCARVSYTLYDQPLGERDDPFPKPCASDSELRIESRPVSRSGAGGLQDSREYCTAGIQEFLRLRRSDLRSNDRKRKIREARLRRGVDRPLLLVIRLHLIAV